MPTTYRGRVLIECTREVCERDRSRANVTPACLDCPGAVATVIGLDEKPVGRIQRTPEPEPETTEEAAEAPESIKQKTKRRK
jgi:hypothetical protein